MTVRLSVVVPTYKRPFLLDRCLGALCDQGLESEAYEIIVADDAGDRSTQAVVEDWRAATDGRIAIEYLRVEGRHGPAAARNRGWRAARADVIAFTDDDCVPARDWLSQGLTAMTADVAVAAGRLDMPLPADPTDYELDAARLAEATFVTANCFCRREVLSALGGLDERFQSAFREDTDLYFTLLERGYRLTRAENARVVHPIRPAPWATSLNQQRRVMYDALLYKKHPRLYREHIRATPRWDYYATTGLLLAAGVGAAVGIPTLAWGSGAAWAWRSVRLARQRLVGATRRPTHVAEMVFTSALIPPLAVFWRAVGAFRFRARLF